MPPNPSPGSVRSSAAVNTEIRELVTACGGWLYGAARVRYAELVEEWTVTVAAERRIEVVEAA
ncbi:hypothetical protein [Streptomyces bluensis]|uniref:hypothetical protein n=1 Tax=Streptomyces bluensis TaxID=33897 RepID=UPI0033306090